MQVAIENKQTAAAQVTWLLTLIPWSVSIFNPGAVTAVYIRFLPIRVLSMLGVSSSWADPYLWIWEAPGFVTAGQSVSAGTVWIAAAAPYILALLLSSVILFGGGRVQSFSMDMVHTLGWLHLLSGGLFINTVVLYLMDFDGLTLPVGAILQLGAGLMLIKTSQH